MARFSMAATFARNVSSRASNDSTAGRTLRNAVASGPLWPHSKDQLHVVEFVRDRPHAGRSVAAEEDEPGRAVRIQSRRDALSGGEQQMLAIARVLAGDPRLLLIDEPTEGLAPIVVDELFTLMAGLAHDGIPIVLVEQNVRRAIDLATRFYVLERGQVVLEGRAADAADRERLHARIAV